MGWIGRIPEGMRGEWGFGGLRWRNREGRFEDGNACVFLAVAGAGQRSKREAAVRTTTIGKARLKKTGICRAARNQEGHEEDLLDFDGRHD